MGSTPLNSSEAIRTELNKDVIKRHRAAEDAKRDPVDAFNDSDTLCRVLDYVSQVLNDPATRYLLGKRIREDLVSSNLESEVEDARLLRAYNLARLNELSNDFKEQNLSSINEN